MGLGDVGGDVGGEVGGDVGGLVGGEVGGDVGGSVGGLVGGEVGVDESGGLVVVLEPGGGVVSEDDIDLSRVGSTRPRC